MAQPRVPYSTSPLVSDGISVAYSTLQNPRNLETYWNAPFCQTFRELLDLPEIILYSPFTLWMPSINKRESILREKFEKLGLDLDDEPDYDEESDDPYWLTTKYMNKSLKKALPFYPKPKPLIRDQKATRESARLPAIRKTKMDQRKLDLADALYILFKERKKFVKRAEKEHQKKAKDGYYDTTIESISDVTAFERHPDYFAAFVAGLDLPTPRSERERDLHIFRGGKKIFYSRGLVIGELKAGTRRGLTGKEFRIESMNLASEALNDLAQYCSAYFACFPDQPSIIAVGSAGGYWTWSNILREQAPEWDLKNGHAIINDYTDWYAKNWHPLFASYQHLGTKKSDAALEAIRNLCVIKLDQVHPLPDHLKLVIDDDTDEDDDEEEDKDEGGGDVFRLEEYLQLTELPHESDNDSDGGDDDHRLLL